MNTTAFLAAIEAQFLMGHCVPSAHWDGVTTSAYSWEESQVRQALHVPLDTLWDERVLALEMAGLAVFCMNTAPLEVDEQGAEREIAGWRDQPRDQWGTLSVSAPAVLRLAALYGRPVVRAHESPAVLVHWELVQREAQARLTAPHDAARWRREWPEQYARFHAWERAAEDDQGEEE